MKFSVWIVNSFRRSRPRGNCAACARGRGAQVCGMPITLNREDAWKLLTSYTTSDSLLKHALAVEASVAGYARKFGEDEQAWSVVALLHDFDYERWPTPEDHPFRGCEILREQGYPEWF